VCRLVVCRVLSCVGVLAKPGPLRINFFEHLGPPQKINFRGLL
jgi:hypothetical protein